MPPHLIVPYGGQLVRPMVPPEQQAELKRASREWLSWTLTPRQICDLELLLSGALSPLAGYLGQADYDRVVEEMRLGDGTLWPLPVVLDVDQAFAEKVVPDQPVALRDPEGVMLAVLDPEEIWRPDREREAELVYGTGDRVHPGVARLLGEVESHYVGGPVRGLDLPTHYDFRLLRHTPDELRQEFVRRGWRRVMAFHTRSPLHRVHHAVTVSAARTHQTNLLLHPVVEQAKPGAVEHFTRIRCYQEVLSHYPKHTAMLSLLPLSMRMAGPREALLHGIIRRNYGCSHLIVGEHHASPPGPGEKCYEPYAAQELFNRHQDELQIQMAAVQEVVYVAGQASFLGQDQVPVGEGVTRFSSEELRRHLEAGRPVPSWFSFPRVIQELTRAHPPRHRQGFTVFFTGLSGAGKSTIANVLLQRLLEAGGRPVTLLDGDIVRRHLSSELTFSQEHRDINIRRIGFVASEITKNGGVAICAPIAPYNSVRREVRDMVSAGGGFILVHVATPLSVCETRDRKGMYAKARAGIIDNFTGISDPYEEPEDAEVAIDTTDLSPTQCTQQVLLYLEKEGYLGANGGESRAD